jgi:Ser/Thr protein kinase RdoA (MazF antagonist)
MNTDFQSALFSNYPFSAEKPMEISLFGEGLIHETFLIKQEDKKWILQGFNESVFNFPDRIDLNLGLLHQLAAENPLPFQLPLPLTNCDGSGLTNIDNKKYRLFDFVQGKTLQQIEKPVQAYIAAKAYGTFAAWAKNIDAKQMQETIPNFHRLDLRFEKLSEVAKGIENLSPEEKDILDFYLGQKPLVHWYLEQINQLPLRVTHNDTKINNLIFSEDLSKVEAVIDLDTLMVGYLMYDFGDLVRTVACSFPETHTQWSEIHFMPELFKELLTGYWEGVKNISDKKESESLLFGGEIMTLIMGLRFFTDHLQGNVYYRVNYPEQNFDRAKNQMIFLISQQSQRKYLLEIWKQVTSA